MNGIAYPKARDTYLSIRRKRKWSWFIRDYQYYLLLLPAVVWYAIFAYGPLYGVQIAFKKFNGARGILGSSWVGFRHFTNFFNSYFFSLLVKNTLALSVYSLLVGTPIPIIIALMLNEIRLAKYKKTIQTIIYAPYFISTPLSYPPSPSCFY